MAVKGDPETSALHLPEPPSSRGLSLLVMGPAGTATYALPERGDVILGRSQECDVRIDDAKLSRRHAKLRVGAQIELFDLGSMNGTIAHDTKLAPHTAVRIAVGDSIVIGGTVLVVQRAAHGSRPRHVWSHGYFEGRLEEECARASQGAPPFAVLRLRVENADDDRTATREGLGHAEVVAVWLQETDIVAKYAPNEYEVLLVACAPDAADARGQTLAEALRKVGVAFRLAVAAFPRDGRTPEAIVERLSRMLSGADAAPERRATDIVRAGAIERLEPLIARVAAGVINVLVLGETGVGKEVLARRIHDLSPRKSKPLLSINCAALSEALLESELFGHEKGAFTGAVAAKDGLLESANGGTVFLDEVGEMPLGLQAKLLRVLEQREVTRVGALRPRPIDVRFVAATNRDLEAEVAASRFRQDLYFRLNGIALTLPPLRDRVDEIEPLCALFVAQACRAMGRAPTRIDAEAMALMKRYAWPGNVRELRNTIERAVLLCSGDVITKQELPTEKMGQILAAPPSLGDGAPAPMNDGERARIIDALEKCGGNQSHAAKLLGISRGTLIKRIEELGLPRPRKRE
jgi:DNA-binding NtrC family response regulator